MNLNDKKKLFSKITQDLSPLMKKDFYESLDIKLIGEKSLYVYLETKKTFISRIIFENIYLIKKSFKDNLNKNVLKIFLNNISLDSKIFELKVKSNIKKIDLDNFINEITDEISGEGFISNQKIFKYDLSALSKKKISLEFYNKFFNLKFHKYVDPKIFNSKKLKSFKRKKIVKKITNLLELKYYPINSDTEEIVNYLQLK